ncbi:MAG: hypothetical protein ABIS67_11885, partial [Candidatus Eisenbacteria bacterium]
MIFMVAAVLLPLHFTAPADTLGTDRVAGARLSPHPVHSYVFHRVDSKGTLSVIPGYADANGTEILVPHSPGTREKVWLEPGPAGSSATIFVLSRDANGNLSDPSNGCVFGNRGLASSSVSRNSALSALDVPNIQQTPERCGPAALAMVLRFYGAA